MSLQILEAVFPADVQRRLDEIETLFNADAVMGAMNDLSEQIDSVQLSRRFSRTTRITAETITYGGGRRNPLWYGLTEDQYKRQQLRSDIEALRFDFARLCTHYKVVYLEVEASQREYD